MILRILRINLKVKFNNNIKYDGVKSKVLDITLAKKYGWRPKISFKKAIMKTYQDLEKNYNSVRNNQ